jgi:hypothetical protein
MAGFEVSIYGRFWVSTEAYRLGVLLVANLPGMKGSRDICHGWSRGGALQSIGALGDGREILPEFLQRLIGTLPQAWIACTYASFWYPVERTSRISTARVATTTHQVPM